MADHPSGGDQPRPIIQADQALLQTTELIPVWTKIHNEHDIFKNVIYILPRSKAIFASSMRSVKPDILYSPSEFKPVIENKEIQKSIVCKAKNKNFFCFNVFVQSTDLY